MSSRTYAESLQPQLSGLRQLLYYLLTRWPWLYLSLEARRRPGNWNKRVYLSFVHRGGVVLDIGANFGVHTLLFSYLTGRLGKVLAFEPVSASYDALAETVAARARFPNIQLFRVAIGNPASPAETAVVNVPAGDFGQASLRAQSAGSWQGNPQVDQYSVPITKLDSEPAIQALERIDFVKIDVEGGELDALKGAARTLSRQLPLLYCEIYEKWTASFGYTPADLMEFAGSLGYTDARVLSEGKVHPFRLGEALPLGWFETSSDVLFFTQRDSASVRKFDRRFRRWLALPRG